MFAAAVCGTVRGDRVTHTRQPLLKLTGPFWYCARRPSRSGSVSRQPKHAPRGAGRGTVCGCGAFAHGLTRPCAAFFRLVGLLHFGCVPLKAGVLIQDCSPWIAKRFGIDDLFVMHFPGIRLTQIAHALGLRIDHHDVLVTMRFLLAAVVQGLLDRVFRTLPPPIGPVNNQLRRFLVAAFMEVQTCQAAESAERRTRPALA